MWRCTVNPKQTLIVLVLAASPLWAHAACADCGKITALQKKFDSYNYANRDDRDKGAQDIETVDSYIQDFVNNKAQAQNKTEEFKALVKLIASALPYDDETSLADSLSDLIEDPTLKKTFTAALTEIPDTCHRDFLASAVAQHSCVSDQREAGTYEKGAKNRSASACTQMTDFDQCLSRTPKTKRGIKRK